MAIARGVAKKVAYKKETAGWPWAPWGELPGPAGAKYLRRVTSDFTLNKETYESNEIRTDYQVADFRHGVRSAAGTLNGELSAGSYSDFMAAVVAQDFAAVSSITPLSITITAPVSGLQTVVRATGSWITDGVQVGNVIRLSGGTLPIDTTGVNLLVVDVVALTLTVRVVNGTTLTTQGSAVTGVTCAIPGKKTFAPTTGHTNDSFTIEQWFSDISQSEVYTGMKVGSVAMQLPSTGLTTVDISFQGKDLTSTGTTQYFTSPTAASSTGIFAAVNGAVIVNGVPSAVITSADFTVERGLEAANVVGSNNASDIFTGRIRVNGNISVYFQDAVYRDMFKDETEASIVFALSADNSGGADVLSFVMPRVKLGSASASDSEMGLITQHSFVALLNTVTTAGLPATTIQIQDTSL